MAEFNVQKITSNAKTVVTFGYNNYSSMIFTNVDASDDVTIDLYAVSQVGSAITDTGTNVNQADSSGAVTTGSTAITVDGTSATDDIFKNERIYKSDGTFVGTCTIVGSTTSITFGGGIEKALANNDDLYVGTRYYFLNNVKIPNGTSLKLTPDEFNMDTVNYKMYILSGDSDGMIDIITRY